MSFMPSLELPAFKVPGRIHQLIRDQWLKLRGNRKGDGSAGAQEAQPPLPFLLEAQQTLSFQDSKGNEALNGSAFFQLLPLELRRMIPTHAFGDRILHMHLGLNHPLLPGLPTPGQSQPGHSPHGGASVPWEMHTNVPRRELRDTSKPKVWQWWSCVCHRRDSRGGNTYNRILTGV